MLWVSCESQYVHTGIPILAFAWAVRISLEGNTNIQSITNQSINPALNSLPVITQALNSRQHVQDKPGTSGNWRSGLTITHQESEVRIPEGATGICLKISVAMVLKGHGLMGVFVARSLISGDRVSFFPFFSFYYPVFPIQRPIVCCLSHCGSYIVHNITMITSYLQLI